MVPALVESIRTAGLVLVTDMTGSKADQTLSTAAAATTSTRDGIDGVLDQNGVMRFGPMMV